MNFNQRACVAVVVAVDVREVAGAEDRQRFAVEFNRLNGVRVVAENYVSSAVRKNFLPRPLKVVGRVGKLRAPMRQDNYQIGRKTFRQRKILFDGRLDFRKIRAVFGDDKRAHERICRDKFVRVVAVCAVSVSQDRQLDSVALQNFHAAIHFVVEIFIRAEEVKLFGVEDFNRAECAVNVHVEQVIVRGRHEVEAGIFHGVSKFVGEVQIKLLAVVEVALRKIFARAAEWSL